MSWTTTMRGDENFSCDGNTKEECIARFRQMQRYQPDLEDVAIMVQREWCPNWLARLARLIRIDSIGYYELKQ